MKTLLCAIVKNENRYINEWIVYHKNIGFDGIILYDNNDIDGEILNVKQDDFIRIIDYRGKHIVVPSDISVFKMKYTHGIQEQAYNDCYLNQADDYDWIAFFDIDEFLFIENNMKINDFLSQSKFNNVDSIQLNWKIYGDNGHIKYENKPVIERFTEPSIYQTSYVKTIIKTKNPNFISLRCHYADIKDGRYVYPNGNPTNPSLSQKSNLECAYLKHFYTKSIEEWIERKYKQTMATGDEKQRNETNFRIIEFFFFNESTQDKINIIKDKIKEELKPDVWKSISPKTI